MPNATFWFARPFSDWIGQRSLTLHWEGRFTVRDVFRRLAADHPAFRTNMALPGLEQEAVNTMAAIIMDGNLLSLESEVRDGATVDVLLPLTGGGDGLPRQAEAPARARECSDPCG
jgi:hypothetical protein